MSKLLRVLIVSVLLVASLASVTLADLKPEDQYIPKQGSFEGDPMDLWVELDPRDGGSGFELPQGANAPFGAFGVDDFIRGGPVTGDGFQQGIPIGFDFHYMQGPADGIPTYGWTDPDGIPNSGDEIWEPQEWNVELTNEGYDEVYVSLNGYVVFDTGTAAFEPEERPAGNFEGLGTRAWNPVALPDARVPNNFIAAYWTDLTIADNTFDEVTSVGFVCTGEWANGPTTLACDTAGKVRGPHECVCAFPVVPPDCGPVTGYWTPCTVEPLERPRGKLLYKTVGDEPNRTFVVQWSYARNIWTGHLATFQVQLYEGNGRIVFLYKEFTTKAWWEGHGPGVFNVAPGLLIGMEDWYGGTSVGWSYLPQRTDSALLVGRWELFNPVDDGDGFIFEPGP